MPARREDEYREGTQIKCHSFAFFYSCPLPTNGRINPSFSSSPTLTWTYDNSSHRKWQAFVSESEQEDGSHTGLVLDRDGLESCSDHAQATACVTLGAGPTSLLLSFLLCNLGVILLVPYGCCQVDSTSRRPPPSTKPGTNWTLHQDHLCSMAHISGAPAVCWVLRGALGDMESAGS